MDLSAADEAGDLLTVFSRLRECYNWTMHVNCLVSDHYKLLVMMPDADRSKGSLQ